MAITDSIQQIQILASEIVTALGDGDTKAARVKLTQIQTLFTFAPMEMRDEFAQIRMQGGSDVNELLKSLEEQITEMESGGELTIQRIAINLGSDDETCACEL